MTSGAKPASPGLQHKLGDIFYCEPADVIGVEIQKDRPWVLVSRTETNIGGTVVGVPLTTERSGKHYPPHCIRIPSNQIICDDPSHGMNHSIALVHQIRVLDKTRLRRKAGALTSTAQNAIQQGLTFLFDL